jgi:hypothetical protein
VRKLKRGIQRALSRDSQFRQRTSALRPRRPPRSIEPAPPIGESPIPRRLQNLQISSAPKFLRLPSFFRFQCQTFPNFCGSNAKFFQRFLWRLCGISKGCVRDPNRKIDSPNFCPPNRAQKAVGAAQSSRQAVERLVCTLTDFSAFRKRMSFFVQRGNAPKAASCEPATKGIRKSHEAAPHPARLNFRSTRISSGASQRACGLKSHASFPRRRRPNPSPLRTFGQ